MNKIKEEISEFDIFEAPSYEGYKLVVLEIALMIQEAFYEDDFEDALKRLEQLENKRESEDVIKATKMIVLENGFYDDGFIEREESFDDEIKDKIEKDFDTFISRVYDDKVDLSEYKKSLDYEKLFKDNVILYKK